MNYGYASEENDGIILTQLDKNELPERFSLQLYHYLLTAVSQIQNFNDKDLLEVGSGRGGGINFIQKYLKPKSCVGVDFSGKQVQFCKDLYKNIEFFQGDAENLLAIEEIQPYSKDIIISVETSHCYGNLANYANQVYQVLKPKGLFLWTDFLQEENYEQIKEIFKSAGLKLEQEYKITQNVIKAMQLNNEARQQLIQENVHTLLKPIAKRFAGTTESAIFKEFISGGTIYVAARFSKILVIQGKNE